MVTYQANLGWMGPDPIEIAVTNRRGSSVAGGDVVVLDNGRVDADSTSNEPGVATSGVSNIVATTTETQPYGVYGVVKASAADNFRTAVRLRGKIDSVNVSATVVLSGATKSVIVGPVTTTVAAQVLAANAAALLTTLTASGGAVAGRPTKIIFVAMTARTGAGLTDGWFDGINGFGTVLIVPN